MECPLASGVLSKSRTPMFLFKRMQGVFSLSMLSLPPARFDLDCLRGWTLLRPLCWVSSDFHTCTRSPSHRVGFGSTRRTMDPPTFRCRTVHQLHTRMRTSQLVLLHSSSMSWTLFFLPFTLFFFRPVSFLSFPSTLLSVPLTDPFHLPSFFVLLRVQALPRDALLVACMDVSDTSMAKVPLSKPHVHQCELTRRNPC